MLALCTVFIAGSVMAQDAKEREWVEKGRDFWAFRPVSTVPVPRSGDQEWPRGPIDRFILARLEAAKMRPASATGPYSLIRRLTFDLTGLPPAPADVETFAKDSSDGAFDRLVDRLLASPAFGERWGRHWLDVVRFAESSGGGRSLMFENAWRFRDYVIDSYNVDRPFDTFVLEQIAGDLLPYESDEQRNRQLVATGFLELGPTNYEQQDKELLRMEVIDEQIDTVGRAFMGLTLGCARCHDHKFDPIPTRDYYALAGIFGSTDVLTAGNVSGYVEQEFLGPRSQKWYAYRKRIRAIEAELKSVGPRGKKLAPRSKIRRTDLAGIVVDDVDAQLTGVWIPSTFVPGYLGLGYIHDENTEKGGKSVRYHPRVPKSGVYDVRLSYTSGTNRATNVPVVIKHADGEKIVKVNQRAAPTEGGFVSLGRFRFLAGETGSITVSNDGTDGHVIVDSLQLIPTEKSKSPVKRAVAKSSGNRALIRRLQSELKTLKKSAPPKPEKAMAVRDVKNPIDGHVHTRGLVRKKGAVVPRGFVTVCGGEAPKIPKGESGRLQLAKWLANPSHPLTARVYVNRVWHYLFGVGLVRTTDNFGVKGERPSHPELLDWLVRRFIDGGWSTKKLIREIVRTNTYRSSVRSSPESDANNRLLSHAHRRRLDAESIRDAILVISGQLDPVRGGKTIRKMSQYDYDYEFDSRRRSVYVPRFRSNRMELFDVFDAANPNTVTGVRNVSNVATQALYLLNSPWVMEQSKHAAKALLARGDATVEVRIDRAYLSVVGRPPSAAERQLSRRYVQSFGEDQEDAFARLFHTLFACVDFRYLD
jgi:hypothetical protein